jgi:hypothetical protein
MNRYKEIFDLLKSLEDDFDKFYNKDNGAAGTRARQGMQAIKNMAHEIRKEIQDRKNTKKTEISKDPTANNLSKGKANG